tara:strand:+ start:6404 stop:7240 length:837 start_codon:yes stop_codon:yes gene_type:complete
MAKKAKAEEIVEVAPQEVVVETTPKKEKPQVKKPEWEIKNRVYYLKGRKSPLTLTIPGKHTRKHALLWFDSSKQKQRELRYATNMSSPFADEQVGEATLGHIVFKDGTLNVPSSDIALQKLLSLYHPLKDKLYYEFKPVAVASNELENIEWEIDALNAARNIEIDQAEAIMRVELGSKVATMSSKEIKRDLLLFARRNPRLFIDLASDENVMLRNLAIRAQEAGIIKISQDQRTFFWGSNDRKLMNVPFDENPYSAFAAFLKTDEGVEIYKSIDKKLN